MGGDTGPFPRLSSSWPSAALPAPYLFPSPRPLPSPHLATILDPPSHGIPRLPRISHSYLFLTGGDPLWVGKWAGSIATRRLWLARPDPTSSDVHHEPNRTIPRSPSCDKPTIPTDKKIRNPDMPWTWTGSGLRKKRRYGGGYERELIKLVVRVARRTSRLSNRSVEDCWWRERGFLARAGWPLRWSARAIQRVRGHRGEKNCSGTLVLQT